MNLKTVKLASTRYLDDLPSEGNDRGVAIRDREMEKKVLELTVEVPVEDMARMGQKEELPSGAASQGPKRTSIWTAIHPRLVDIIRERYADNVVALTRKNERAQAIIRGDISAMERYKSEPDAA